MNATPSLNQPSPLVKAEALALLDSAFEAEFDLLPEDAKQLCDTFYRGLRKRLGHPVEAAIERSAAANGALTFQLLFRSADEEPTEPGWYLLYNQCDGFHQVEAWCDEDGEFTGFREWCANDYFPKDGYCAWARLPDTEGALYDTFARTVPTGVRECD